MALMESDKTILRFVIIPESRASLVCGSPPRRRETSAIIAGTVGERNKSRLHPSDNS
jgi:hypothetical protein